MMKLQLLSPALSLAAATCTAQVTFTSTDLTPIPGEAFSYADIPYAPPGPGGTGLLWDLSGGAPAGSFAFAWQAPTTDPDFPTADLERTTPGYFEYYDAGPAALSQLGMFYGLSLATTIYTDPRDELRFPLTLGSAYSDAYAGISIYPDGMGSYDTAAVSGTYSVEADAVGTLVLPWATYTDVLRLHVQHVMPSASDTTRTDEYRFVAAGEHAPLLRMYETTYSWVPGPIQEGRILLPGGTAITEAGAPGQVLSIAPNPVESSLLLTSSEALHDAVVVVRNTTGQEVRLPIVRSGHAFVIDTRDLCPGIYIVSVERHGRSRSARFVKQ